MQTSVKTLARIAPVRRRLITDDIIDRLVAAIAGGMLRPGERLVEESLAAELGVSRVPIREAMRELWLQGILKSAPGRGWKVAAFDDHQIDEVCSVRLALESMLLAEAIPRLRDDPEQFSELDRILNRMRRGAADGDVEQVRRADVEFHRAALSAAEHSLGLGIWEGISRQVLIIFGLEIRSHPDLEAVLRQHEELRGFLSDGDPGNLVPVLQEHITGWRSRMRGRQVGEGSNEKGERNNATNT